MAATSLLTSDTHQTPDSKNLYDDSFKLTTFTLARQKWKILIPATSAYTNVSEFNLTGSCGQIRHTLFIKAGIYFCFHKVCLSVHLVYHPENLRKDVSQIGKVRLIKH